MEFETNRRRFLELAGPATAASLAGCSALSSDTRVDTETGTTTEATAETRTVGVSLEPDQQALQERQAEIRSALQAGNITRTEAQEQFRTAQTELRSAAVESFTGRVESNSGLEIEDGIDQFGLLLLSGTPTALLDTLSVEGVVGLLPEATFEEASAQAQTATATETVTN